MENTTNITRLVLFNLEIEGVKFNLNFSFTLIKRRVFPKFDKMYET